MTRRTLRIVGGSLSAVAGLMLIFILTLARQPVAAASCCQDCEVKEAACARSCNNLSDQTERQTCLDVCYDKLYTQPSSCWYSCYYCTPRQPPGQICVTCEPIEQEICDDDGCHNVMVDVICTTSSSGTTGGNTECLTW